MQSFIFFFYIETYSYLERTEICGISNGDRPHVAQSGTTIRVFLYGAAEGFLTASRLVILRIEDVVHALHDADLARLEVELGILYCRWVRGCSFGFVRGEDEPYRISPQFVPRRPEVGQGLYRII
jgi:hypothetical protein